MVALDMNRQIINDREIERMIRNDNLRRFRIHSKFIDEKPVEVSKDEDSGERDLVEKLHQMILEYAKHLPHRQIMLKIREHDTHAEIIINPVTGAA